MDDVRPFPNNPASQTGDLPLQGILVVAVEHAVAGPYCSSRLADAGARVIKIERLDGDLTRRHDNVVHGDSSYFVWLNRGKESIALDLKQAPDLALLRRMLARADVYLQNLAPGAAERLGIGSAAMRAQHPTLITCDISGYGERGPLINMKAFDLMVQAESGLASLSGAPVNQGCVAVPLCDINAGMSALVGIQQALLARARTGRGSAVKVSLFDAAAELMGVPYLQARYGGRSPMSVGLKNPTLEPYGAYTCADGREIVIAIQSERDWTEFCYHVLREPALADDPRCNSTTARLTNLEWLSQRIAAVFGGQPSAAMVDRLSAAHTPFGNANTLPDLIDHPQLRTRRMPVSSGSIELPAPAWSTDEDPDSFAAAPTLDQHGAALRAEFARPPSDHLSRPR